MLVIIWHLLSDPETRFIDLGADHFTRHVNTQAKKRNHVRQLEALSYRVTLETAA
jgi:transposase